MMMAITICTTDPHLLLYSRRADRHPHTHRTVPTLFLIFNPNKWRPTWWDYFNQKTTKRINFP
jgi:hypothetical protein